MNVSHRYFQAHLNDIKVPGVAQAGAAAPQGQWGGPTAAPSAPSGAAGAPAGGLSARSGPVTNRTPKEGRKSGSLDAYAAGDILAGEPAAKPFKPDTKGSQQSWRQP